MRRVCHREAGVDEVGLCSERIVPFVILGKPFVVDAWPVRATCQHDEVRETRGARCFAFACFALRRLALLKPVNPAI